MTPFEIRRGTVADAAELAELAARTFSEAFAESNTPEDLDAHLRATFGVAQQAAELADPDVCTLLALQEGRLVAYAQVRRKSAPDCVAIERPVELHRIYLLRSVHGTGLAARLLKEAGIAARELEGENLWLGVWEHNDRALAFYRKSGFKTVGNHVFVVGSDRQTDLVLVGPPLRETDQDAAREHT
jgi:ribosomal protein S18 acetylase RimI-like enzyme